MADPSQDQDKSEPATHFKLEEARKKGQVFKSTELSSLAALTVALIVLLAFADWAMRRMFALAARLFNASADTTLSIQLVSGLGEWAGRQALFILSPLLFMAAIIAIAVNVLQTGPVFSATPLKPDLSRLNPVQGFKRVFSMRSLYEGFKSCVKLAMLGGITYGVIGHMLPKLFGLTQRSISTYPDFLVGATAFILFLLILGFVALALFDVSFSRWEFMKKMRMSRRELRDEIKRREGDPQIRAKRKELLRSLSKRARSAMKVKDADVLITNPTHLAVALRYRQNETMAPVVIAKGAGELAARMRKAAFRYGVTVVESPPLARRLFASADLDSMIPSEMYSDVAEIYKRLRAARENKRKT